jgi:localization factor PodJL
VFLDRAARAGIAPAQFSLGGLYEKGLGVRKDVAEARRLYAAAAAKGHARAMHDLAVLYTRGINGRPDYATAAEWFRKAAGYGLVDSEYSLGILYARGIGVERDPGEAYKWFALAAKGGDRNAGRERDEVAKSLDAKELEAARASAENFVAMAQPDQATATRAPAGGWDQVAGAATTKTGPPARPERFPGK